MRARTGGKEVIWLSARAMTPRTRRPRLERPGLRPGRRPRFYRSLSIGHWFPHLYSATCCRLSRGDRPVLPVQVLVLAIQSIIERPVARIGLVSGLNGHVLPSRSQGTWPSAAAACSAAPCRLHSCGSRIWRTGRPKTSAWIWHHTADLAPPPIAFTNGSDRPAKRSVDSNAQRVLKATPSKTALTICRGSCRATDCGRRRGSCYRRLACARRRARV